MNPEFIKYISMSAGLAFTAGVQPGPLQAYLLSRVAASGWRKTLPAAFAPIISDGPIALVSLLILGQLSPAMQSVLRLAGGLLLMFLAFKSFQQWRSGPESNTETDDKIPQSLREAVLVNLLNPNPYLGWALILGPMTLDAWQLNPLYGVSVVATFYLILVTLLAITIVAFGTSRFLGPKLQKNLILLSVVILAVLGIYQMYLGAGVLLNLSQNPT